MAEKKKVTLMLTEEVARELRVASAVQGQTQSALVEHALIQQLRKMQKREKKK